MDRPPFWNRWSVIISDGWWVLYYTRCWMYIMLYIYIDVYILYSFFFFNGHLTYYCRESECASNSLPPRSKEPVSSTLITICRRRRRRRQRLAYRTLFIIRPLTWSGSLLNRFTHRIGTILCFNAVHTCRRTLKTRKIIRVSGVMMVGRLQTVQYLYTS